jgi:cyclophilin family peptidyl-prolyl cis-trans isomerase/HEAT repeat protein
MIHRFVLALALCAAATPTAGQAKRPALSANDIGDIALLLKLEDTRQLDAGAFGKLLRAAHPEVRRRAAVSIGRINNADGATLLDAARADTDIEVVASVAFAYGQLKAASAVEWLGAQMSSPKTAPAVAREAARSLGKIRTPEARAALAGYLTTAPLTKASAPIAGEALLAIGRFTEKGDVGPIARWATSDDAEIRWRAAWALFRPRNPAALPHLLKLIEDASGDVRYWAARGLSPEVVDGGGGDRTAVTARLNALFYRDSDRRVRTEALRTLLQFDNETAFGALVNALYSADSWLSVSAAEAAGRFTSRARPLAPLVADVAEDKDTIAMRITALPALITLAPEATVTLHVATSLVRSDVAAARNAGIQGLGRLGDAGRARLDELAADPQLAGRIPQAGARGGRGGGGGGGRGGGRGAQPPRQARPDAEYRQLVEQWVVPAYDGRPAPRAVIVTARGDIEVELYPGDAPFGVEHFLRVVESGAIVGTEFSRVVPNFVAQQQGIPNSPTLRDEVNRRGLTAGNLSWASAGLDTGRPGYTLGTTPQPHNEGDFTSLGRVVRGMDVVDRIELGDKITGARMIRK